MASPYPQRWRIQKNYGGTFLKAAEYIDKKFKQLFHLKHEIYTKLAYLVPGLCPDRFVFVLTNLCNLRCTNCYQDKVPKNTNLTKEQWIRLSDEIPGFARVTITGGEPLLYPGFREVFENVARRHQCNVITNGILLTEEVIDTMLSYPRFKVLAVSLDGTTRSLPALRGMTGEQLENLRRILGYFVKKRKETGSGCVLEIKTLILDENAEELLDIHKFCVEELGADHHTLQFLKGSPLQHSDKMYVMEEIFPKSSARTYRKFGLIKEQFLKIREYNIETGSVAFLHPPLADLNGESGFDIDFLNEAEFNGKIFKPCRFPWSSVHINYDGEVFPCISVSIGNAGREPLKNILKSGRYREFLSAIRKNGTVEACNRCGWLRVGQRKINK